MGKIQSYGTANSPISGSDKLIGTDSADNNATKNFTINEISSFVKPYRVYSALISQAGSFDPVATVLQNELGDISWGIDADGEYWVYSADGVFTQDKTFVTITHSSQTSLGTTSYSFWDEFYILVYTNNTNWDFQNEILDNTSIEIRVYNS